MGASATVPDHIFKKNRIPLGKTARFSARGPHMPRNSAESAPTAPKWHRYLWRSTGFMRYLKEDDELARAGKAGSTATSANVRYTIMAAKWIRKARL
jgi:hypothetical protein